MLTSNLVEFTKYFFEARGDRFIENWHHYEIANALKRLETGEIKNLVINMPPRYGKTEVAVINWIAQCLARNPKAKFIHLSYSDDLALDNSSKAKELVESEEFQQLWALKLKEDSKSKKKWYTAEGGGLYATSAGGPVTGFGAGSTEESELFAGAIIIDDPLKVDDAERDAERQRVNARLNNTIKSRRNSRSTPIVIIMQRLHEDDMTNFVLEGNMGEEFYHLKLQAIQEDGTALWPYKHTIEELEREKAADIRTFCAQMQQEPSPQDGEFFQREWFRRFHMGDEPDTVKYGASDFAVSEGKGDYTEHGIAGFDKNDDLWLLGWWSGQTTADKWIEVQIDLAISHDPATWVAEAGVIRRSVEPFLTRAMRERNKHFRMEWLPSNQNKAANARGFQALASQGKVHIPYTPWGDELIEQLIKFPVGKYDDKVDVCGLFGRILDQTYGPRLYHDLETINRQKNDYGNYSDDELQGDAGTIPIV